MAVENVTAPSTLLKNVVLSYQADSRSIGFLSHTGATFLVLTLAFCA
jgi:hypothetical protein